MCWLALDRSTECEQGLGKPDIPDPILRRLSLTQSHRALAKSKTLKTVIMPYAKLHCLSLMSEVVPEPIRMFRLMAIV